MRKRVDAVRQHPGQVLILFAIMIPAMIAMIGLGLDTAYLFKERRQLQNVADLAALGGVSQLPDDAASAESIARELAALNGVASDSVTANASYDGDFNQLEISVSRELDLLFMSALGIDSVTISARAVAEHTTGKGTAIFAKKDTHCWNQSIHTRGSNITIDGDAHSNSGMTINGSNNTLTGDLTYKGSCVASVSKNNSNPNIPNPQPYVWQEWPIVYSESDFPCTYTLGTNPDIGRNGSWWVNNLASSKKLKSGVICYHGTSWMTLNANDVSGNVTFRARNIQLTGSNYNLTPYLNDVLIYSTGTSFPSLVLNVSGGSMTGMLYEKATTSSPNQGGQVIINGSSGFTLYGSIVSWAVVLEGSNWSIINNLEGTSEPAHLVE